MCQVFGISILRLSVRLSVCALCVCIYIYYMCMYMCVYVCACCVCVRVVCVRVVCVRDCDVWIHVVRRRRPTRQWSTCGCLGTAPVIWLARSSTSTMETGVRRGKLYFLFI